MSLDIDDPKLTAYVLGELEEAERQTVEAEIAASPALQTAIEEIRRTSELLMEGLANGSELELTDEQRARIFAEAQSNDGEALPFPQPNLRPTSGRPSWPVIAVAASLLIACGLLAINYDWRDDDGSLVLDARQGQRGAESPMATEQESAEGVEENLEESSTFAAPSAPFDAAYERATQPLDEASRNDRNYATPSGPSSSGRPPDEQFGNLGVERALDRESAEEAQPTYNQSLRTSTPDPARDNLDFQPTPPGPRADRPEPGPAGSRAGGRPRGTADDAGFGDSGFGGYGYRLNERPESLDVNGGAPAASGFSGAPAEIERMESDELPKLSQTEAESAPMRQRTVAGESLHTIVEPAANLPAQDASGAAAKALADPAAGAPVRSPQQGAGASEVELQVESRRSFRRLGESDAKDQRAGESRLEGAAEGRGGAQAGQGQASGSEAKQNETAAGKSDAQERGLWQRARVTPHASRLKIGDQDELPLKGMQVNAHVDGFRARVLVDCYFYNDRNQQLEGNFQLRLPNEASLYYFAFGETIYQYQPAMGQLASTGALDANLGRVNGTSPEDILRARADTWSSVKEARMVPRVKAAHAYSEVVRRRVDPALVEWAGAGVFNARVFPLMPNKLHRIVIGYDVNLKAEGNALVYQLDLPEPRPECMVDLNVAATPGLTADVTPNVRPFTSGGRAYYHFNNPTADAISVRLEQPGQIILTGSDAEAGDFFATRLAPQLPAVDQTAAADHALLLLDTSLSASPEKFNVWRKLLESILEENRQQIRQFNVLFFNVEAHWWKDAYTENTPENVAALLEEVDRLALEGATDLRLAIAEATADRWRKSASTNDPVRPDVFLLSDGAATWGMVDPQQIAKPLNEETVSGLFAYRTGMAGTASEMLENLTRAGGGSVFSVANEAELPAAATAHRSRPWIVDEVRVPGAQDVLIAGGTTRLYPGQTLYIAGRGMPQQDVLLRVRQGDDEREIRLPLGAPIRSELAPRIYGQLAVGELEMLPAALEDVAVAYARHFRVPGQTCSLLMLESEADYQRYNIRPEEDALAVKSSRVSELVAKEQHQSAERLQQPKEAVQNWLQTLQQMPGFELQLSTAFELALDHLPDSTLQVPANGLACQRRDREVLGDEYAQLISTGSIDYAAAYREAERRRSRYSAADGLKVLSNLVEEHTGDWTMTRDVAFAAMDWGFADQAYPLLRQVIDSRPYEPQTYLAAARCLSEMDRADLAIVHYEVAVQGNWHGRYRDFRNIAQVEYLALLKQIQRGERKAELKQYAEARLASLSRQAPVTEADLVVVMMWNTDRTDVDLHVVEPSGAECYYQNPRTPNGGQLTADVTEGLGPEMYFTPKVQPGDYQLKAHYFGSDANRTSARTKVYLTIYRNFGRADERVLRNLVTLDEQKQMQPIMTVGVK